MWLFFFILKLNVHLKLQNDSYICLHTERFCSNLRLRVKAVSFFQREEERGEKSQSSSGSGFGSNRKSGWEKGIWTKSVCVGFVQMFGFFQHKPALQDRTSQMAEMKLKFDIFFPFWVTVCLFVCLFWVKTSELCPSPTPIIAGLRRLYSYFHGIYISSGCSLMLVTDHQ